jgi:uncharacterized protein with PQ loop repeat
MHIIELIYLVTTFASVFTALPQLKQLWKMKNSDEFNLFSWVAWCLSQVTALFYSITIHSVPYLLVNIAWISFYVVMIGLILKYRRSTPAQLATEEVTSKY